MFCTAKLHFLDPGLVAGGSHDAPAQVAAAHHKAAKHLRGGRGGGGGGGAHIGQAHLASSLAAGRLRPAACLAPTSACVARAPPQP